MRWYRAVEPVSRVRRPSIRPASDERRSALVASRSFFLRPRFGWRRAAVRIPTRGVAGSAGAGAGSGSGCRGARDRSRSRARGVRTATRAESEAGTTRRSEMRSSTLARRGGGRRVHGAASGMDASAAPRLGKRATRDAEPLPVGRTRKACRRAGGEMDVSALPVRCLPPLRPSPLPARPTDRKSPRRFFFPPLAGGDAPTSRSPRPTRTRRTTSSRSSSGTSPARRRRRTTSTPRSRASSAPSTPGLPQIPPRPPRDEATISSLSVGETATC
jgi:hypothetical protein